MLAACWTLYGIAGVVVLMRVYTQLKITRQFGIGDSIMILALVRLQLRSEKSNWRFKLCGFSHIIFLTISHHYGLGRHFFFLTDFERVKAMEMEFISEPFGENFMIKDRIDEARLIRSRNSIFYFWSHLFRSSNVSTFVSLQLVILLDWCFFLLICGLTRTSYPVYH